MRKDSPESVDRARRLLLKTAIYSAPIVIDVIRIKSAHAAQPLSCAPATCSPNTTPCSPSACKPRA